MKVNLEVKLDDLQTDFFEERGATFGEDSEVIMSQQDVASYHYFFPYSRQKENLQQRFNNLVSIWKDDIKFTSSLIEMVTHPAYQEIIGMGPAAIPLLLRELEQEPDHWFWALTSITGENPVKVKQRGDLSQMTRAWLTWAEERGYRW